MYKITVVINAIAGLCEMLQEACDNGVAGFFELSDAENGKTKVVFERDISDDADYIETRVVHGFSPDRAACHQLAAEIEELGAAELLPLVEELKSPNFTVTDLNFDSVQEAA